jgi:3-oxoadipate enol-lactonase
MTVQRFLEIGGAGVRYALEGETGPLVVLVHEMGGCLESWDRLAPLLSEGRRVLRFDMRGFGLSGKMSGTADLNRMADDLAELMRALDVAGPAHLCGMAVGGALVVRFAARHPAMTASLAAMGPALGVAADRRAGVFARADRIERDGIPAISIEELGLTYPESLRDPFHFPTYRARWLGNDPESYAATYRMLAGLNADADLRSIVCPCLFLAGALDPLRPPALIEPLADKISNARFEPIEAGHVMAFQKPGLVHDALVRFWPAMDDATPPGEKSQ